MKYVDALSEIEATFFIRPNMGSYIASVLRD
jgi:hypothetical protein